MTDKLFPLQRKLCPMKLHLLIGTAAVSTALYSLNAVSYYLKNCTHL